MNIVIVSNVDLSGVNDAVKSITGFRVHLSDDAIETLLVLVMDISNSSLEVAELVEGVEACLHDIIRSMKIDLSFESDLVVLMSLSIVRRNT